VQKVRNVSVKVKSSLVFSLTILFGSLEVNAQHIDVSNPKSPHVKMIYLHGSALFSKDLQVKKRSAENLYSIINAWTISTFNSASTVVKRKAEDVIIQGVGVEPGIVLYAFPRVVASLKYSFTIEVEDDKICFSMSDMNIVTDESNYTLEEYLFDKKGHEIDDKHTRKIRLHATKIANVLVNSLQVFLVENSVVSD